MNKTLYLNIILPLKLAWRSLIIHKGRTILTVVGIIIGIAAVIIVMSAGESIKGLVMGQLESFGSDFVQIEPKVPSTGKNSADNAGAMTQGIQVTTLKLDDAEAVKRLPNVKNYYVALMGQEVVSYLDANKVVNYMAVSSEMVNIDKSKLDNGRFFYEEEDKQLARVVVLGSKVAVNLFSGQDPVGQSVKIGREKFRVIGVFKERGGSLGLNYDDLVFIPVRTAQKIMLGVDHVMWITAQVDNPDIQDETAAEITSLLRERHDITDPDDDDFSVTTMAEARDMINTVFGAITLLLVAIAGISLIVGGVGIMNIMYVSVTERTFEIGLRKSIGARTVQILWQFLWEAITVTIFGGIIGIIVGVIFTFLVSAIARQLGFNWPFQVVPTSIGIAFGFSAVVGLIFGYYPAKRAAGLNPIEALRHE